MKRRRRILLRSLISVVLRDPALAFSVTAVVALTVSLRLPGALDYSLWQDEVASARIITADDPIDVLRGVARTESTPPFWYLLGWITVKVGVSAEHVRMLSVVFAGALGAAIVVWGRRILSLWASVLAAALTAVGDQFVIHGRELRAYSLYALLSVVFAVLLGRYVREPTRGRAAVLALCVALGCLTHYLFLLVVTAGVLWLWVASEPRSVRARATAAIGAGLLPFAAWLPVLVVQYQRQRFAWIGPFDLQTAISAYWRLFVERDFVDGAPAVLIALGFAAVVAGGAIRVRSRSPAAHLCALLAVVPVLIATLIWLAGPRIFSIRNLLGVGPFAALAIAAVVARLPRPTGWIIAVLACGLGSAAAIRATEPVPYEKVASILVEQGWTTSDPIVLYGNLFAFRGPLRWYLPAARELTLGKRTNGTSCRRAFVVAARPRVARSLLNTRIPTASSSAGEIAVFRIDAPPALESPVWRGGLLLVTSNLAPSCARPVAERGLRARLEEARL